MQKNPNEQIQSQQRVADGMFTAWRLAVSAASILCAIGFTAAFDYWKGRFPVSSGLKVDDDCGLND
jgi:anti-sigma-K factor RskA